MRVIAGKAKGRKLRGTPRKTTRAVTDRIKESVFGILGDIEGKNLLDLFAGTGSLGIEGLSRGAAQATFVEKDRTCASLIRKNLSSIGLEGKLYCDDVMDALRLFARRGDKFDLIFVDPPFGSELLTETLQEIDRHGIVAVDGIVVARHHAKQNLHENFHGLSLERKERYGENVVCFYKSRGRSKI